MERFALGKLETVLAGTALLILASTVVLSYQDWRSFRDSVNHTRHSEQVLRTTELLLSGVKDAETGQRGYLLTGDRQYLEPYTLAVSSTPDQLKQLAALIGSDPRHTAQMASLESAVAEKMVELKQTIDVMDIQGSAAATEIVRTNRGKQRMDRIRDLSAQIMSGEYADLNERSERMEIQGQRSRLVTTLGSAILFVMLLLAGSAVAAAAARREKLIGDLRASEKQTTEVRDLLQTTLSSIGDAVITTEIHGRVTFLNPVAQALTGYTEEQALGKPIEEVFRIINESSRATVESPVAKVLREGKVVGLANHTLLVSRNGVEIPIDDSGAPIRHSDQTTQGVVLVFRDITERKKTEGALRESEERLRLSAEAAQVGYWSYELNQKRVGVSPQLESMLSIVPGSLAGSDAKAGELLHPEDRERTLESFARSIREMIPYESEFRIVPPNGETRWMYAKGAPISAPEGQFIKFAGVMIDITGRKRLEEKMRQSQKLESLGVLAGGIAHDFNNLLVGILGNACILSEEIQANSPQRDVVENLMQASERAAHLTRQMLAYSGKGRFNIERLNLEVQVRQILALIDASIPKGVRIELNFQPDLPPIEADAGQIQQLIMNLAINGAEAIGSEGGVVAISTTLQEIDKGYVRDTLAGDQISPGAYIVLEVHDTGIGMDSVTQAKIFDPFFTTKFTGRGLGLAAVQGIVRGHKGALTIYSEPGKGSTFKVFLPVAVSEDRIREDADSVFTDFTGQGTILVVDDEELVQRTLHTALTRYGFTVLTAGNGPDAIRMLSEMQERISLVLLDMTMPVMSGEETLHGLQAIRDVPVIATSGYNELEALKRFGRGISGFIQKPYTPKSLAERIRNVLEKRAFDVN